VVRTMPNTVRSIGQGRSTRKNRERTVHPRTDFWSWVCEDSFHSLRSERIAWRCVGTNFLFGLLEGEHIRSHFPASVPQGPHDPRHTGNVEPNGREKIVLLKDLARCTLEHDASAVENDDSLGDLSDKVCVVGDEQKCHSDTVQPLNKLEDALNSFGVEPSRRFVYDENLRPHGDGTRHGHEPLLASTQQQGGARSEEIRVETDEPQSIPDPCIDLSFLEAKVTRAESHLLQYILFEKLELRELKDQTDLPANLVHLLLGLPQVSPIDEDPA